MTCQQHWWLKPPLLHKIQNRQWEVKFPSHNPVRHKDSFHTPGSTKSCACLHKTPVYPAGWQYCIKFQTSTLNTSASILDRKVPLFLSPELCQASSLLSAALKGTFSSSSSSSSGRKVEGGKTAVKRLSIPLHRGRFKAWLGLPWQHICLMINPQKSCSSRQQSFVSREGPGRNCGGPRNSETMEPYGVLLSWQVDC